MYVLCSDITIGGRKFGGVHSVEVKRSVYALAATAKIKVPVTALLRQKDAPPMRVETAQQIQVGNSVEIRLGYNGALNTVFRGYVKTINLRTPVEIECEDAFYLTRWKTVTADGKTTLEALLRKCDLDIGDCTPLTLADFEADAKPVSWVLGKLKADYGLCLFFDLDGKVYAAEPGKGDGKRVKYRLRYNVIKDDDLLYRRAEDTPIKIKAICIKADGSKVEATIGPAGGMEKTLHFYDVSNTAELAALADAELKRHSYDGYSGKIETFLWPPVAPTCIAEIEDEVYTDRNGSYYVESVTTSFGMSGARNVVEIGIKV